MLGQMRSILSILLLMVSAVSLSGCSQAQVPHLEPPSGLAHVALSQPNVAWELTTAAEYTTYAQRGTYTAAHRVRLHERSGEALGHALGILGEPIYPAHLRVFYVSSRDEMLSIAGACYTGTADVEAHAVLLVEIEEAYGSSVESIKSDWTAWLRSTPVELRPASTAALRRTGCG